MLCQFCWAEQEQKRKDPKRVLVELTQHVDAQPVECDGATRLVHLALYRQGMAHVCYAGSVIGAKGEVLIDLHFWTEADGFLIDYRCRTPRLPAAPHGVFLAAAYPDYHYQGKSITLKLEGCLAMEIACQPAFIQAAQQLLKQE
jgi:hypothetical protein